VWYEMASRALVGDLEKLREKSSLTDFWPLKRKTYQNGGYIKVIIVNSSTFSSPVLYRGRINFPPCPWQFEIWGPISEKIDEQKKEQIGNSMLPRK
jgi:hypothetical protein